MRHIAPKKTKEGVFKELLIEATVLYSMDFLAKSRLWLNNEEVKSLWLYNEEINCLPTIFPTYSTVHELLGQNLHTMSRVYSSLLCRLHFFFSALTYLVRRLVAIVIFGVVHCWCCTINGTQRNMLHNTSVIIPPIIKACIELAFMPVVIRTVVGNFVILVLLVQRVEFALASNWSSIESLYWSHHTSMKIWPGVNSWNIPLYKSLVLFKKKFEQLEPMEPFNGS